MSPDELFFLVLGFTIGTFIQLTRLDYAKYKHRKNCKHERLELKESREIYDSSFNKKDECEFECLNCGKKITGVKNEFN